MAFTMSTQPVVALAKMDVDPYLLVASSIIYIYMCNFLPDYVLDVCAYIQTDQIGSNTMILHLGKHGDNQRVQKMIILHHIPLNKRWSTGSRGRKSFGRVSDVV